MLPSTSSTFDDLHESVSDYTGLPRESFSLVRITTTAQRTFARVSGEADRGARTPSYELLAPSRS